MIKSQTVQIKVTLPSELYLIVKANADKLGLNLASYIRHLTINDTWEKNLPTFRMTPKQEKTSEQAEKDFYAGKAKPITDVNEFISNL